MNEQLKPEIIELLAKRNWSAIRDFTARWPIARIAHLLLDLEGGDRVLLFRALSRQSAAEVFAYFDASEQDDLLSRLTGEETRQLLANLRPDDRTALLEELPAQVTQRLLSFLSAEDLCESRQLLGYPEDSVGRLMTPDYVTIRPEWNVGKAMEHVRTTGRERETVDVVYVTDPSSRLLGAVSLRQLVLGKPADSVRGIMRSPAVSVSAFVDREEAAALIERYDLAVLPVLDSEGLLVGIITGDDVFSVVQEEETEDFQKSAAVRPIGTGLLTAKLSLLYRNRIGWLLGLAVSYFLSGTLLAHYEGVISQVVTLVCFLPLIIDSAGNAGSQSATLMVRALATGDVDAGDWGKVIVKELGVSLALALTMSLTVWAVASYRLGFSIAVIAAIALLLVVVISCGVGAAIPFALNKFGMDSAAASSPLVTAVADIIGVFIYFTTAKMYLGI